MIVWLWLLLPIGALIGSRLWVTRVVVPAWRAERLTDSTAAVLVAISRGLTLLSMVVAAVMIAGLPPVPGLLTAALAGLVYGLVGWRSIRAMFRTAER
ncbi:MAG TPA: hypothetical protein VFH63_07620 [candidate division Zixibacteria bacterium]|nr:hypothetical protein [candidate division Zixibacteria bacterium]